MPPPGSPTLRVAEPTSARGRFFFSRSNQQMKFGVGQSVKRTEDLRLVTGQGQYTDDIHFPNETYAAFLRSPHGHAKITSIDISAAKSAPGVVDVLTQDDVDAMRGAGSEPRRLAAEANAETAACQQAGNVRRRGDCDGDRRDLRAGQGCARAHQRRV